MDFKTVAVVGLGYIGLPTAAAIATRGIDVIGVDVNASTIDSVNRGEVPFVEPDLAVAVSGAVTQGHLTAQKEMPEAAKLIRTAREINDPRPYHVVAQVVERAHRLVDPVIACLGLTFKANVDDVRESPALLIVEELSSALPNARILAVEPNVDELPTTLASRANVEAARTQVAIDEADIGILLVDHTEFCGIRRNLPPRQDHLRHPWRMALINRLRTPDPQRPFIVAPPNRRAQWGLKEQCQC